MKNKILSIFLALFAVLLVVGSVYLFISYISELGEGFITFFSSSNMQKMSSAQCGLEIPPEFESIRSNLAGVILPAIYLGLPLLLVAISLLMFGSGYYYGKHKTIEKYHLEKKVKEEVRTKVNEKMKSEKEKKKPKNPEEKPEEKESK
ncbi:hypothetical protein JXB01_03470 [Candidatus Micrarchaeota archaeon]|nr:hypothetical protein [Candidatus Micrarchaeota archaeon]